MGRKQIELESISLGDIKMGPPQILGGVRLVPLLREDVREDLRLTRRNYGEDIAAVNLSGNMNYYSFVPHALVADWTGDGTPVAAFGAQTSSHKPPKTTDGTVHDFGFATARVLSKMRAKEARQRLRFLPLNMAMEGFLNLHFGGPSIAWEEYSRSMFQHGLGSRSENVIPGRWVCGLEDALRVFEIHPNQVGVLVFVGDALASIFVVPHPDDYRDLHGTLITDMFGELIYIYGLSSQENVYHPQPIDSKKVESVEDLRRELARVRDDWSKLHRIMTTKLIDCSIHAERIYKMGPFQMQRFITDLDPNSENHIGELIVRADGRLEYMKSFRLSGAQTRRAYLLSQLAKSDWNLEACAKELNCSKNQLVFRLEKAGFGYFVHQHVLDAARAEKRRRSR